MKAVLVISDRDNVATALVPIVAGRHIDAGGVGVGAIEAIAAGHKIAIRAIPAGGEVIKYGSPIGRASRDIPAGAHVHTHNVLSSRGRGDIAPAADGPALRLAEPPDDQGALPNGAARLSPVDAGDAVRPGRDPR